VALGRPVLWGLAVDGSDGVRRVLEILRDELQLALTLCGCSTLEALGHEHVQRAPAPSVYSD
jgi:isopentenyl diphosphate isomerase/L-lactate dehydrogenase-like FMN-dependent dehydrogenase